MRIKNNELNALKRCLKIYPRCEANDDLIEVSTLNNQLSFRIMKCRSNLLITRLHIKQTDCFGITNNIMADLIISIYSLYKLVICLAMTNRNRELRIVKSE